LIACVSASIPPIVASGSAGPSGASRVIRRIQNERAYLSGALQEPEPQVTGTNDDMTVHESAPP